MASEKAKTTALFCAYSGQSMARRWVRKEDIFERNGVEMALIRWASNRYRYDPATDSLVSRTTGQPVPFHPNALKNVPDAAPEIFIFDDPNNVSKRGAGKAAKNAEKQVKKDAKKAEVAAKKAAKQAEKDAKKAEKDAKKQAKKKAAADSKTETEAIDDVIHTGTSDTLPTGLEPIIEATPAINEALDEAEDDIDELDVDDDDEDDDEIESDDDEDDDEDLDLGELDEDDDIIE